MKTTRAKYVAFYLLLTLLPALIAYIMIRRVPFHITHMSASLFELSHWFRSYHFPLYLVEYSVSFFWPIAVLFAVSAGLVYTRRQYCSALHSNLQKCLFKAYRSYIFQGGLFVYIWIMNRDTIIPMEVSQGDYGPLIVMPAVKDYLVIIACFALATVMLQKRTYLKQTVVCCLIASVYVAIRHVARESYPHSYTLTGLLLGGSEFAYYVDGILIIALFIAIDRIFHTKLLILVTLVNAVQLSIILSGEIIFNIPQFAVKCLLSTVLIWGSVWFFWHKSPRCMDMTIFTPKRRRIVLIFVAPLFIMQTVTYLVFARERIQEVTFQKMVDNQYILEEYALSFGKDVPEDQRLYVYHLFKKEGLKTLLNQKKYYYDKKENRIWRDSAVYSNIKPCIPFLASGFSGIASDTFDIYGEKYEKTYAVWILWKWYYLFNTFPNVSESEIKPLK